MEKITRTYEVYSFQELAPEIQEKVLDEHRGWNVDYGWWDWLVEEWKEELDKKYGIGIDPSKFYFELDRNRCIYFTKDGIWVSDQEKLADNFPEFPLEHLRNGELRFYFEHVPLRGGLFKNNLCLEDYTEENVSEKCTWLPDFSEWLRDEIFQPFLKKLIKEYEYLTSDEAIKETFELNGTKFLKNGEIFF